MWLRFLLAIFFLSSLLGAFIIEPGPTRERIGSDGGDGSHVGQRLRLLSWNIGYGDLEPETRAHAEDLPAVAEVILSNDADAVALQELTGADQLKLLLAHLKSRYRGYVCNSGGADRVEAVLVKVGDLGDGSLRFNDVAAGDKFAAAATFRFHKGTTEVVIVSAHADAFNASRRRSFTADLVDWARARTSPYAFIAGDLNFEVNTRNKTNLFTDDAKHDSESYAYLLKYFRDLGRDAGETSINDRRIDYVFGPSDTVSVTRTEVLRAASLGRMDHWPLLVEVAF